MSAQGRPQDYAAAIYDLAFEAWLRQLESAQKALAQDAPLRTAVQDTSRPIGERLEMWERAMKAPLNADVRSFLGTLLEAGQIDQLQAIMGEFERLVRRRPEHKLAQVVTAVPLTGAEREALEAKLADRYGPDLEFEYEVDPSIIGGVRLRVGDRVIDGSIAGKLAALRERLAA